MATTEELLKHKRELLEQKKLKLFEQELLSKRDTTPTKTEALLSGLSQGLSFGFMDEAAAIDAGIKGFVTTPGSLGQRAEAFGLERDISTTSGKVRRGELREAFPKTTFAGEALGGGVTGGGLFKQLSGQLRNVPLAARLSGIGALEGTAFGAGTADPGEKGAGALFGAGIGAAATPLGVGIGVGLMSALRPVARRLGEGLLGTPRDRAVKEVMRALDAEDITKNEAFILLRQMGRNATIADLGDAPARLGRMVTSEAGVGASRAKRFLDFRQLESQSQLRQAARRATGASDFDKGVIEVINNAESAAAPIYNEVFSEVLDVTQPMLSLLKRPAMQRARKKAATFLANEGFATDVVNDVTDVRYMDAIKRALDDDISAAIRQGNKNNARILTDLKKQFVGEIDAQVPRYAEARSIFSGEASMREAADVGRTIFKGTKTSVSDAAELIGKMSESDIQAARYGFLEWLSDELAGQSVKSNRLANKFADVPRFKQMAQLLFPSQQHVDDFLRAASTQSRFAQTKNLITGGSPTARIQADRQASNLGLLRVGANAAFSQLNGIISALRLISSNTKLTPDIIDEIGQILFDPRVIPKQLTRGPSRLFEIPKVDPITSTGAIGGLVGSQQDQMLSGLRQVGLIGP